MTCLQLVAVLGIALLDFVDQYSACESEVCFHTEVHRHEHIVDISTVGCVHGISFSLQAGSRGPTAGMSGLSLGLRGGSADEVRGFPTSP